METPPPDPRLRMAPFIVQATRGVIRERRMRRGAMALLLVLALGMIAAGLWLPGPWREAREHPVGFILFWLACGWLTVTASLLALIDLLVLRLEARRAREELREDIEKQSGD